MKDRTASRTLLERAVRKAPQSKEAWNNLGAVAARDGRHGPRALRLKKAIGLDGGCAEAWFNLGMMEEQAGHAPEARVAWGRFLAIDATSGWAKVARAHLK